MRIAIFAMLFVMSSFAFANSFIPGIAVSDAGRVLDKNVRSMQAFYIPDATTPDAVLSDIAGALRQAARLTFPLAIIGPNYTQNAEILQAVLLSFSDNSLRGATIIFVNDGEETDLLRKKVEATGAVFLSSKYSGK